MSLILIQETASSVPIPPVGKGTVFLNTSTQLSVKNSSNAVATIPTLSSASNTYVVYNNAGIFGQSANFVFNETTSTLTLANLVVSGTLQAGDISVSSISNGTSNVDIVGVSGNVTTSVAGNANIVVVTGTGVVVSGNLTANGAVGNGIFGGAKTSGSTRGTGVTGQGYVTASADTGAAVGVRGFSTDTHSGGYNVGVLGNASGSGLGNYAFYVQAGNIASIETATSWDLVDNSPNAISFNSTGKANILGIETTDGAEGIFTSGYLNVSGNVTATRLISNIATGTAPLTVTSTTRVANLNVATSGVANTVNDAAQGNITSVGTLTSVSVSGNANIGNIGTGGLITATGNITGGNLVTGGVVSATGNVTGNYILGNGALLTGVITSVANINNGTSNVTVVSSGGNITVGVGGTSNVAVFTSTGANITGTLSASGNANVGNIGATLFVGNISGSGNSNVGNLGTTQLVATGAGSFGANLNMNTNWINNVGYPSANTDAASKIYVDTLISTGISYHQPVYVATTTTLATATGGTTAYNSPNGAANGIGAYISTTGTFLNIDGSNVQSVGRRILVKDEANAAWNGVYTYANTTAIVRATDADESGTGSTTLLGINDYFFTQNGTVNEGVAFVVSAPSGTITFGTSDITFSVFSTSQVYDAGTGLTLTGTTFSVNTSQTQVTAVGTLTTLSVSGNATVGNLISGGGSGGNITGANLVSANFFTGTLTTAAQPNITSVGILTSLSVVGNIAGGNLSGTNIVGTLTTAAQPNITSVGTLTSLTLGGTLTGAVQIGTGTATHFGTTLTTGANSTAGTITGNWSLSAGSRLNATYADLAEKYVADADYEPGTVLVFGGNHEVTLSTESDSFRVAGVVTTNPAYTMNNDCEGEHVATIALQGRVPVKVIGPTYKGDLLVSCGNGYAIANNIARAGTIIGKSLENFNQANGVIEVAIGRF